MSHWSYSCCRGGSYFSGMQRTHTGHCTATGRPTRSSQRALGGVVKEGGHGREHLVTDVGEHSGWMKGEMAWPGAGREFRKGRVVGCQRPLRGVEAVDEDLVEAEVGSEGEPVRGIEVDR